MLAAFFLVAAAPGPQARAADVDVSHSSSVFAIAFYYSVDPSDRCIATQAYVFPSIASYGTGQQREPALSLSVVEQNYCTGERTEWLAGGVLPPGTFVIAPRLDSASLDATLDFCDFETGVCVPGEAHLTWTGAGGMTVGEPLVLKTDYEGCKIRSILTPGRSRPAATTGAITIDGETIVFDSSVSDGLLATGRGIDVEIGC